MRKVGFVNRKKYINRRAVGKKQIVKRKALQPSRASSSRSSNVTSVSRKTGIFPASAADVEKHYYGKATPHQQHNSLKRKAHRTVEYFKDHKKQIGKAVGTTALIAGTLVGASELAAGVFGAGEAAATITGSGTAPAFRGARIAAQAMGRGVRSLSAMFAREAVPASISSGSAQMSEAMWAARAAEPFAGTSEGALTNINRAASELADGTRKAGKTGLKPYISRGRL